MTEPMARRSRSCSAYGVDGAVRGAMIGCMWGVFSASYYGWHDNLRGKVLAGHIGRNVMANSCGFAAFLGLYQLAHCSVEASRGRCDWKNAAAAGLLTGGVMGLPMSVRIGEPKLAVMAAGLTCGKRACRLRTRSLPSDPHAPTESPRAFLDVCACDVQGVQGGWTC